MTLKGYRRQLAGHIRAVLSSCNAWNDTHSVQSQLIQESLSELGLEKAGLYTTEEQAEIAIKQALLEPETWDKYLRRQGLDITATRLGWRYLDAELRKALIPEVLASVLSKGKHYNGNRKPKEPK